MLHVQQARCAAVYSVNCFHFIAQVMLESILLPNGGAERTGGESAAARRGRQHPSTGGRRGRGSRSTPHTYNPLFQRRRQPRPNWSPFFRCYSRQPLSAPFVTVGRSAFVVSAGPSRAAAVSPVGSPRWLPGTRLLPPPFAAGGPSEGDAPFPFLLPLYPWMIFPPCASLLRLGLSLNVAY